MRDVNGVGDVSEKLTYPTRPFSFYFSSCPCCDNERECNNDRGSFKQAMVFKVRHTKKYR